MKAASSPAARASAPRSAASPAAATSPASPVSAPGRSARSTSTAAGNAATTLRYSNTTGSTKTLSVYANGVRTGQVSLPAASGWSTAQQTLPLRAGLNLIGYQFDTGDSGNVALDNVDRRRVRQRSRPWRDGALHRSTRRRAAAPTGRRHRPGPDLPDRRVGVVRTACRAARQRREVHPVHADQAGQLARRALLHPGQRGRHRHHRAAGDLRRRREGEGPDAHLGVQLGLRQLPVPERPGAGQRRTGSSTRSGRPCRATRPAPC